MSGLDESGRNMQQDENIGKPLIRAGLGSLRGRLDACFVPLGFKPESGVGTLKYVGEVNGRSIAATFAVHTRNQYVTGNIRYRKYQGLVMDLTADTSVQTRLAVLPKPRMLEGALNFLHSLQKRKPVTEMDAAYEPFRAWADDPDWTRNYLSSRDVRDSLTAILFAPELTKTGSFMMGPGTLRCTLGVVPNVLTSEAVLIWINRLVQIAVQTEKNPPPTEVTPTWLERQNSTTAAFVIVAAFLFGIPLLMFVCCALPVLTVLVLGNL
ncbi:MAG: hypothetical protein KC419_10630 [Anaerolineales bacterium]|nr:hypothetical protein [Anaerolineales bacterium]